MRVLSIIFNKNLFVLFLLLPISSLSQTESASIYITDFFASNISGGGSANITVTNNQEVTITFSGGSTPGTIKHSTAIAYMGDLFSFSFNVDAFNGYLSFKKDDNTIHVDAFSVKIIDGWLFLIPLSPESETNLYIGFNSQTVTGTISSAGESINAITETSYDVLGAVKTKTKSYFNDLGQNIQTQSLDIQTGKIWGNEVLYDSQGRPALQTLSAPISDADFFLFNNDFIKKQNGNTFTLSDFETNPESPEPVGSEEYSLGWYYSENNTSEEYQDVTNYPYSRTIFSDLNPGTALKTIGGNKVDINNDGTTEWISGFSYTMPATQELFYAFGKDYFESLGGITEEGKVNAKFFKSVSIDVHGFESVVFTDGEGKILAAAKSGGDSKYDVVSVIREQGYVDVHIPNGIVNGDIQFLGISNFYRVFDLRTEELVSISEMTGGHFYRVEYMREITDIDAFINTDGSITTSPNVKGIKYKVNYYDYTLNYYDKAGRLVKSTQPLGFDENAFDLTLQQPNHNLVSTYKYNALNQLLETSSPDEGTANFMYREDGQIRFSQNTKQSVADEFSYTNYDNLARPIESGVYFGNTSFGATSIIDYELSDITNVEEVGGVISKKPSNSWNSGIATVKGISGDGYISWKFPVENTHAFVGLSTDNTNYSFNTIDFGIRIQDNIAYVYESGVQKSIIGPVTTNDEFKIERIGTTIYYKVNNVAASYTSNNTSHLIADMALFSSNAEVTDFDMGGNVVNTNTAFFSSLTNATESGNSVSKTSGTETWDSGFRTSQTISGNGSMSWDMVQNNKTMMVGLTSRLSASHHAYGYIDYAVYLHQNNNFYIYEQGDYKGHYGVYNQGDIFKVERIGSTIEYSKNDNTFYTSNRISYNEDLIGAGSLNNIGGSINNISFVGGNQLFKDFINVATSDNSIKKNATHSWDSGFSSNVPINGDGFMQFITPSDNQHLMIGLSETNPNSNYNTIGYAIYLHRNNNVYIYENGSNKGLVSSYVVGDVFKVERTGATGAINYYKNNEVIYTSLATSTAPLYLDASFNDPHASLSNITLNTLNNPTTIADANTVLEEQYCKERHLTLYDVPDLDGLYTALDEAGIEISLYRNQNFVAGNVSKTYTLNPKTTTTWYSYDIYGRVEWMVQEINGLGTKTIDYEYDSVNGLVTKVIYQKNKPEDLFVHRYYYTEIGQLKSVETSKDNESFIEQARYEYYETGALKRTVLRNGIQGTDYVYNLAGQLKAINHPSLTAENDPGHDENDAFGLHIDYYSGDYARQNTPTAIITSQDGQNRYDGNIKATRWATRGLDPNPQNQHNAYTYRYNNNKWLQHAEFGQANNEGVITSDPNNQYLVSNLTYDPNGNLLSLNRNRHGFSNEMDRFTYTYNTNTNQLNYVYDETPASQLSDDLNSQNPNNYIYNQIGQLSKETQDGHEIEYTYNASGLITVIEKDEQPYINFYYNDKGHRVRKEVTNNAGETWEQTFYVRDASGSVMAIYTGHIEGLEPQEYPIYGASRLGVYNKQYDKSSYQLTDHLGNVRAVISDAAETNSYTDYYPFGMPMPERKMVNGILYRYAYQGQEVDPETGKEAFQLRLWDSRIARWTNPDPKNQYFSPYLGMGNNPINGVDLDGGFWEELGNWFAGNGWNTNEALEFQSNGGVLGEWYGDKFSGYRRGVFYPDDGGPGIALFRAKDDFASGLINGLDAFGFEGRVVIGYAGKLSGDVGSNWVKYGIGGSVGFSRMMFIGGDYGYYWNTYIGGESGHNYGLSLATAPIEAQASLEGELIIGIYMLKETSPSPNTLAGLAGSFDLEADIDAFGDFSVGIGATISGNWLLFNTTIGFGLDTTPSIGVNGSTRVIGSTLLTPIKPTAERTFSEMIQNHLLSSPF